MKNQTQSSQPLTKSLKQMPDTLQQQETKVVLELFEAHNNQRDVIYRMGEKITELEKQLAMANDRVRQLESQLYGGK